jgi:hypothetical protein
MVFQALTRVFNEWTYALIAVLVAFVVFVLATWLPNLELVWKIIASPSVPLLDKVNVLASLVGSIRTNFSDFSAVSTIAVVVLFGVNTAMVTYYVRLRRRLSRQMGQAAALAGVGGVASGFLGIGCAACGTFALGPILSFVGATGLITLLPFDGQEFGLLGIALLGFSIFLAAKKINEPLVCPVDVEGDTAVE